MTTVIRAGGVGLTASLMLGAGVLVMFLWPALLVVWPLVFLPVTFTGILTVERAGRGAPGAGAAALLGAVAGGIAGATSAVVLYLAGQQHPLWSLAGVLAAPPWRLGPYPWFGPIPWPLPLLVPLGAALAGVQAWLYYRWLVDPAADVRERLADWVARRPAALQTKLRAGFLIVVAATLVVGWLGFGALENTYRRLHVLELRAEWLGHVRTMHALVRQQEALAGDLGTGPRQGVVARLRQLHLQTQAELSRLSEYGLHPAYILNPEQVRVEAASLAPWLDAVRAALDEVGAHLDQVPARYPEGPESYATALAASVAAEREALDALLAHFALEQGRGVPHLVGETSTARHVAEVVLLLTLALCTALALLLQAVLARVAVRPVEAVVAHLQHVGSGDFSRRLAVPNADELGALADAVNHVNDQLARAHARLHERAASLEQQVVAQGAEIEQVGQLQRYLPRQLVEEVRHGAALGSGQYERRKVTILFADLQGFTDLSDGVEPEELGDLLNEYFALMADAVARHGGTLLDFIGDAVMVVFGAPSPPEPEHDAEEAVALALDIQRAVSAWGASWRRRGLDRAPAVRVGVHSGYATVGTFGTEERTEYAAIGRTTNTAARVQTAASPGGVLVTWATRALAGEGFVYATRVTLQAKGLHAPIEVFAVLGRVDDTPPPVPDTLADVAGSSDARDRSDPRPTIRNPRRN